MQHPKLNPDYVPRPKIIPPESIDFIQKVILETERPTSVRHVPSNFGEAGAGSVKADEWRQLATIFLPIALVILWGEKQGDDAELFGEILTHSMALFQATSILFRYLTNQNRASKYRDHFKLWVDDLARLFPHTKNHARKTVIHMSFHTYDFLLLFGPAHGWWCFPLEHLIGLLQKINTNDRLGGVYISFCSCAWLMISFRST
jgi:hypothetical protein